MNHLSWLDIEHNEPNTKHWGIDQRKHSIQSVWRHGSPVTQQNMPWTKVVNFIRNEHHLRIILMGSIAVWNVWKFRLAFKNLSAANHARILEPYTDEAFSESAFVVIDSGADLVLKIAKLSWNFYPFIWNQTSARFGLQGLTSRALCYFFIVSAVQQVEEGITLLLLRLISIRKVPLTTCVIRWAVIFARRTALSCLDIINYSIFRQEVAWALNLALKFFNLWCIQPLIFLRSQLTDAEVPKTFEDKAKLLKFPVECIRIGSGPEPRARHLKVFFRDYIVVNNQLLHILSNDQALAIFCRELGHWQLGHAYVCGLFTVLEFVLGDLLLLACGTSKVSSFYRIEPGAHIVVHVFLMKYFVQSMLCSLIHGIASVVNSQLEIRADDFAGQMLRVHSASILTQGPKFNSL